MAMNFPANPQDGDLFEGFEYDSTIGAWTIPSPESVDKAYVDAGLAAKIDLTEKDAPFGVSTLDFDSTVLLTQLANIIEDAPSELATIGKLALRFNVNTAANWASNTNLLPYGSINIESGVSGSAAKVKIGDGQSTWADLSYLATEAKLNAELLPIQDDISALQTNVSYISDSVANKASIYGATFSGEVIFTQKVTANNIEIAGTTESDIAFLSGVGSNVQDQLDSKLSSANAQATYAPIASPTFSGTVSLPSATSIGNVTQEQIGTLGGISTASSIQDQLDALDTAIDTKAPSDSPTFTGTVSGITKSMVGLDSVDNTADTDKPISTLTQSALDLKADTTALDLKADLIDLDAKANLSGATFTGDVYAPNLTLSGDLFVGGTTTTVNTANAAVADNMIYLNEAITYTITNAVGNGTKVTYTVGAHDISAGMVARVTGITPSGLNISSYTTVDSVTSTTVTIANTNTSTYTSGGTLSSKSSLNPDLGISGGYNDGTYHHSGIFRDASDSGRWKIFEGYDPEPSGSTIDTSDASFALADLQVDNLKASGVTFSDGTTQTKAGVPSASTFVYKTASYTLDSLSLADNIIEVSSTSATTITIPLDSSVNYPVGTSIDVLQTNTGQVTIAATGGVTINGTPGFKLRTRWSSATMLKRAANTWIVYGDLMA